MKRVQLLLCSMLLVAFTAVAQTTTPPVRSIQVSGSAEMEVVPDQIFVQVDLREYDKKGSGKVDIETIKNKFLAAVKSIGLTEQDISVQNYSGYDQNYWWWYQNKKKKDPDMKATVSYLIKLSTTAKIDELVKKLDDEATQNFFIQKVTHSKLTEFRKQLKIQAIKNAREKAVYLAEAINEQVGQAITINEPNEIEYNPQPRMYANSMMMKAEAATNDAAPPMNVDFKKMKLQFDVQVTFTLK